MCAFSAYQWQQQLLCCVAGVLNTLYCDSKTAFLLQFILHVVAVILSHWQIDQLHFDCELSTFCIMKNSQIGTFCAPISQDQREESMEVVENLLMVAVAAISEYHACIRTYIVLILGSLNSLPLVVVLYSVASWEILYFLPRLRLQLPRLPRLRQPQDQ